MPSALLRGWRIPSATGDAPRPREGSKESVPRGPDPWNRLLARPQNSRVSECQALCSAAAGFLRQRAPRPDLEKGRRSPFQECRPLERAPGATRELARQRMLSALLRGWRVPSPARDAPRLNERTRESVPGVQTRGTGSWRGQRTRASADARRSALRPEGPVANGRRAQT